ncbi:MAG: FadR family transcriptional regulator [Spirochaetaceae bacterium]|nr:MAG: FadR family transcriptional regulator [Spirochaetaceae bacterium]
MDITPVSQKRVSQEIIEQFVKFIIQDDLKAGDRLPSERVLAERFGVSRPSLREALRVMEAIGLVEIQRGGGTYVSDFNITPFLSVIAPLFMRKKGFELEFLELRIMLELKGVEMAARNPRTDKKDLLLPLVMSMKEAQEYDEGVRADIFFHRTIFRLSESFFLQKSAELVENILEYSVSHSRKIIIERVGDTNDLYQQHLRIYEAIVKGDVEEARTAMETHLRYTLGFYLE